MTPPDESRLFEWDCCCFFGATAYDAMMSIPARRTEGPHIGTPYCCACGIKHGGKAKLWADRYPAIDAEITRRKSQSRPAQTPAEFVPKVGDWFEGLTSARSRLGPDVQVRGTFVCESLHAPDCVFLDCLDAPKNLRTTVDKERRVSVTRASLRPSAPPASEKTHSGVPVNGPVLCGDCGKPIEKMIEACARTRRGKDGRVEQVPGVFHGKCPTTQPPESGQPKDPYANFPHGMNDAQIAVAMTTRSEEYRKTKVGQLLRELDRKPAEAASTHPKQWPEGSGEELYSTSGSSGR